ncbi:BglG family transcription antiterminator [Petrocella sp. FN5]|uniref:BglG family transcription antiterminator n=1 Tax=Petrocella sp. FN5 TaxID=3032002 RepID=UPI0023DBDC2B|nr:PRD domain-containing protein [Petrocella sp. FN5]MDF1617275.1 PRD domain-containing protein [Petrocella sp. FN5]
MLTSRMKEVISIILESNNYITVQQISDQINVSTRTILRELNDVQNWIIKHGGDLNKKKGKGISLVADDTIKTKLRNSLLEEVSEIIYTPIDRQIILRAQLLQYNEPTKLYTLTQLLDVTESTIGGDIAQLEPWFNQYNIELIRKPGLGILIDGDEKAKRKAIVALIYEHFHLVDLIDVIKEKEHQPIDVRTLKENINQSIFELLDLESIKHTRAFLMRMEEDMGYQFADNAYIALIIRFSMTLKRKFFWDELYIDSKTKALIESDKIFHLLRDWVIEKEDNPFRVLPKEELLYLTMHLKGSKLRQTGEYNRISMIEDFKVIQLVKEFIQKVESETGIYLSDNDKLIVGLVKHLRPSIYRMKMDLDIINPLVEEIKSMYPKLFQTIATCAKVIEEKEHIQIPEDEIAYLATHIGAVIEKNHREIVKKYQVVVACMYGIGASQLLVSEIERNFSNIHIVRVVSVIDQDVESMDEGAIDLIISTVPTENLAIPCVVVNPVIKDEDIKKIREALKRYKPNTTHRQTKNKMALKEKLVALEQYSHIIMKVIDNFSYDKYVSAKTMMDLIHYISTSLSSNQEEIAVLSKAFIEREEKGSTILMKKGMQLLHCRADIDKGVCLKVIDLTDPIIMEQASGYVPVDTIIVMVGPVVLNQKILEVLSEISRNIITGGFADIIKEGQIEDVEFELNALLDKYYQSLVFGI